jgi:hypothetical protein
MWSLSSWGSEGTRSRLSSCVALLIRESGAQDHCHAPLFLLLSRVLKIIIVRRYEWRCSEQELDAHWELLIIDPRCHEFTRMNLSASPYLAHIYRHLVVRYLELYRREHMSMRSISREHKARCFRLVRTLTWSNSPTSHINVLCY